MEHDVTSKAQVTKWGACKKNRTIQDKKDRESFTSVEKQKMKM